MAGQFLVVRLATRKVEEVDFGTNSKARKIDEIRAGMKTNFCSIHNIRKLPFSEGLKICEYKARYVDSRSSEKVRAAARIIFDAGIYNICSYILTKTPKVTFSLDGESFLFASAEFEVAGANKYTSDVLIGDQNLLADANVLAYFLSLNTRYKNATIDKIEKVLVIV